MDLTTIDMPRGEARKKFLEYRRAVRERHAAEDEQIMRGYKAIANGHQVIHLSRTVAAGGLVDVEHESRWRPGDATIVKMPALAIARADSDFGYCEASGADVVFLPSHAYRGRKERLRARGVLGQERGNAWMMCDFRTMVPPVPPALRPAHHLRNYHVLWEAEWVQYSPPRPPGDPALLRHIGGDLFAVVAVWDLTELEKAVLGGRFG